MQKLIRTLSILTVLVISFTSISPAFAQSETLSDSEDGRPLRDYVIAAFAAALGLDPADVQARLDGGETLQDIAASQGIVRDDFRRLMAEVMAEARAMALRDEVITEEEADRLRWRYKNRIDERRRRVRERLTGNILERLGITREELAEMLQSGMSLAEITESLGVELRDFVDREGVIASLGLSREEIKARLDAGETLREIFEAEGIEFPKIGERLRGRR